MLCHILCIFLLLLPYQISDRIQILRRSVFCDEFKNIECSLSVIALYALHVITTLLRIRAFYFSNHQLMCVSQTQKSQICQFRRDVYFGTLTIVRRGIGQSNTCYDSTRSRSCSEIMQKLKIILFIRDICRTVVSVCKETSKL